MQGQTELSSFTIIEASEVSSLYVPSAVARTSCTPSGLLNSPTISLKDAVFLTSQLMSSRSDALDVMHLYRQVGDLWIHDLLVIGIA